MGTESFTMLPVMPRRPDRYIRDNTVLTILIFIGLALYSPNLDSQVRELWTARFDSFSAPDISSAQDTANALSVDSMGNVYVIGTTGGSKGSSHWPDYCTLKYDTTGKLLWSSFY